jgi:hypothetical protein
LARPELLLIGEVCSPRAGIWSFVFNGGTARILERYFPRVIGCDAEHFMFFSFDYSPKTRARGRFPKPAKGNVERSDVGESA